MSGIARSCFHLACGGSSPSSQGHPGAMATLAWERPLRRPRGGPGSSGLPDRPPFLPGSSLLHPSPSSPSPSCQSLVEAPGPGGGEWPVWLLLLLSSLLHWLTASPSFEENPPFAFSRLPKNHVPFIKNFKNQQSIKLEMIPSHHPTAQTFGLNPIHILLFFFLH